MAYRSFFFFLMKSNCLVLAQCTKWHAQISAENKSNDSNQFIASAKCRWLFLIHQFFLIFNSVSVFQEGIVIVLSFFSSTFDKAHPSPWKTKTFIVSLVISAPFFFVFSQWNDFFFSSDEKASAIRWMCVCVCASCDFLICCCWRLSYLSCLYIFVIYGGIIVKLWLCVRDRNYLNIHTTFICVLRPDIWTTVLLSLGANMVHFISEDFLRNSTKRHGYTNIEIPFGFCWMQKDVLAFD